MRRITDQLHRVTNSADPGKHSGRIIAAESAEMRDWTSACRHRNGTTGFHGRENPNSGFLDLDRGLVSLLSLSHDHSGEPVMSRLPRVWLCCLVPLLALQGCAERKDSSRVTTSPRTVTISDGTVTRHATERRNTHAVRDSGPKPAPLPEHTGIPACDDYLSSYIACHRAANVFPPDQLQQRYEMMRNTLLRDSQNPETRPFEAKRCNALAAALHDALHGKSCDAEPAPADSAH